VTGKVSKDVPRARALVDIHLRLPADDLARIRRLAARERVPYQVTLRRLLHIALGHTDPPRGFLIEE